VGALSRREVQSGRGQLNNRTCARSTRRRRTSAATSWNNEPGRLTARSEEHHPDRILILRPLGAGLGSSVPPFAGKDALHTNSIRLATMARAEIAGDLLGGGLGVQALDAMPLLGHLTDLTECDDPKGTTFPRRRTRRVFHLCLLRSGSRSRRLFLVLLARCHGCLVRVLEEVSPEKSHLTGSHASPAAFGTSTHHKCDSGVWHRCGNTSPLLIPFL